MALSWFTLLCCCDAQVCQYMMQMCSIFFLVEDIVMGRCEVWHCKASVYQSLSSLYIPSVTQSVDDLLLPTALLFWCYFNTFYQSYTCLIINPRQTSAYVSVSFAIHMLCQHHKQIHDITNDFAIALGVARFVPLSMSRNHELDNYFHHQMS